MPERQVETLFRRLHRREGEAEPVEATQDEADGAAAGAAGEVAEAADMAVRSGEQRQCSKDESPP